MRGDFAEAVYEVAGLIPSSLVLSYGDIAELLEKGGPRQVGAVMSHSGGGVPWWRVVRSGGAPPRGHSARALPHYEAERTPLRPSRRGAQPAATEGGYTISMVAARWHPSEEESAVLSEIRSRLTTAVESGPQMSETHDGLVP